MTYKQDGGIRSLRDLELTSFDPLLVTEAQLKTALNSIFENQIRSIELLLDIADYSTGIAYVVFQNKGQRDNCLSQSAKKEFIFLT